MLHGLRSQLLAQAQSLGVRMDVLNGEPQLCRPHACDVCHTSSFYNPVRSIKVQSIHVPEQAS